MPVAQEEVVVRHRLLERVAEARRRSDGLFGIVRREAMYDRPIPERHRIIFYVGHLEAFDWNLLHEPMGLKSDHAELDRLFAFGIDPVDGGLPSDQPSQWPTLDAVGEYVASVRGALDEKLEHLDAATAMRDGFPVETLLNVAIEHRLMHAETLAYMLHQLALDRKIPQPSFEPLSSNRVNPSPVRFPVSSPSSSPSVNSRAIQIPSGVATMGLVRGGEEFGWDNEFEMQRVTVPAFAIDEYEVTNGEFLEFMKAGGYEKREFWKEKDWEWKAGQGVSHPVFWVKGEQGWLCRTMFAEIALPLEWPVYVSRAEAEAYARWAGKALPTEAQWQRAAYGTQEGNERRYPWGNGAPSAEQGNFDFHSWDPTPVNAFPAGQSAFGVQDMLGNGWEWTATEFAPFEGFEAFPFYRGYSGDFFDGKHFVLKGGSARTAACMLRPTFRNWFQAHYQYAYAGFRCVKRAA